MELLLLIGAALRLYMLLLIGRAVFSWLPPHYRDTEIYRFLRKVTEPVLRPIREVLPTPGGIDFSPLVAILLLELIAELLIY